MFKATNPCWVGDERPDLGSTFICNKLAKNSAVWVTLAIYFNVNILQLHKMQLDLVIIQIWHKGLSIQLSCHWVYPSFIINLTSCIYFCMLRVHHTAKQWITFLCKRWQLLYCSFFLIKQKVPLQQQNGLTNFLIKLNTYQLVNPFTFYYFYIFTF